MANYLPVLLVSGSTNTIPDDSSLVTLPRGQVDYLSHDWEEEDVWRSWRNMTRQKNEITNGIRLENASWRTWWKQRNKLKTVSPETLNWLKDCDVTWLYGPLHTAVDWTSPPKPSPVPDSVDSLNPTSAHDRLDLSTRPLPTKPILKHRSISEFLTSDFPPTSPVFSPVDSDEEHEATDMATKGKRPAITHTKSDTQITRWAHNRTFRKDPPGLDSKTLPPSLLSAQAPSAIRPSISQDSNSSTGGSEKLPVQRKKHISFNTFVEQCIAIEKPKKNASGFFGPGNHNDDGVWIEGRSAYVDDDGYDEDDEDDEEYTTSSQWETGYHPTHAIRNSHSNSPIEEEEDEDEDDDGIIEIRSSSSSSTYRQPKLPPSKKQQRSQSKVSTTSSSSSTSTSTTNSSASRSSTTANTSSPSSPNTSLSPSRRGPAATSHQSSKTSTSPGSNNYNNSLYRPSRRGPPLIRTPSEQMHVTIAPIAPTILKTTGAWAEGFGDEGASDDGVGWAWALNGAGSSDKRSKSASSFGGDGGSHANGGASFGTGRNARGFNTAAGKGDGSGADDAQASDGTPVELVYVPPLGSNYSLGLDEPDYPGEFDRDAYAEDEEEVTQIGETVYHHSASVNGSIGFGGASFGSSTPIPISSVPMVIIDPEAVDATIGSTRTQTIRQHKSRPDVEEEDAYDFFGGADLGEDYYYSRRGRGYERERGGGSSPSTGGLIVNTGIGGGGGGYGYTERTSRENRDRGSDSRRTLARSGESAAPAGAEERQSRSRSRSQSRTPSPAFLVSPPTNNVSVPPVEVVGNGSMGRRRGSSASLPSAPGSWITRPDIAQPTSDRLSPPARGRQPEVQSSYTTGSSSQSRGRSSTRTSSSSSWERGGSLGSSPLGSLSPDGGRIVGSPIGPSGIDAVLGGAAVLAGGGRVDRDREGKEREREKQRGRERRGRDRTSGKVLSASEVESLGREDVVGAIAQSPTSSDSASNNTTIMGAPVGAPEEEEEPLDPELGYLRRAEEEQRRRVHPTPSNSPVVSMRPFDDDHAAASSSVGTATPTTASTTSHSSSEMTSTSTAATTTSPSPSTYTHTRTPSGISVSQPNGNTPTSSPAKLRPPPLIPSPPLPAKPSTSFAAVSSPHIAAIASPTSPTITMSMGAESSTIVGKAVDIVSSAGVFLGLWSGKEAEHYVAGQ